VKKHNPALRKSNAALTLIYQSLNQSKSYNAFFGERKDFLSRKNQGLTWEQHSVNFVVIYLVIVSNPVLE